VANEFSVTLKPKWLSLFKVYDADFLHGFQLHPLHGTDCAEIQTVQIPDNPTGADLPNERAGQQAIGWMGVGRKLHPTPSEGRDAKLKKKYSHADGSSVNHHTHRLRLPGMQ